MTTVGRVSVVWAVGAPRPAADLMVREEAGHLLCTPTTVVRTGRACPWCGGSGHGRPVVRVPGRERVHASISRSGPLTLVAVSTVGPVGVDVEAESATAFDGFASVVLHRTERDGDPGDRATTWARKESLLKATGHGLAVPPAMVAVTDPRLPPRLVHWPPDAGELGPLEIRDVDLLTGYRAALTLMSGSRPAVSLRQVDPAAASPTARPRRGDQAAPR